MVGPVNNPHPNVALDVSGIQPAPLPSSGAASASASADIPQSQSVTFSDSDSIGSHTPPLRNRLIKKFKLTKPTKLLSSIKKSISNKTKRKKYSMEKPCETESVELKSYITESEKPIAEIHNIDFSNPLKTCDGRDYKINQLADGKTELLITKPPITRLVFSGGGAKGAGLPGAINALDKQNLLSEIKEVHGTSIGSIASAFVASGMSAKRYEELSIGLNFHEGLDHKKFNSKGRGLERIIQDNVRKSLTALSYDIKKADGTVCPMKSDQLIKLNRVLMSDTPITFAHLKLAGELNEKIKELHIAVTAYFGGAAQTIICNAETTPDLPIARACRYSASLPVVFSKMRHDFPFLVDSSPEPDPDGPVFEKMPKISDGGILLNTPIPEFYLNSHTSNPILKEQSMIFGFHSPKSVIPNKGGVSNSLTEKIVKAPMNSEWYRMQDFVKSNPDLLAQYIEVPLTTDSGFTISTLDFSATENQKQELVQKLEAKVTDHLDKMKSAVNRYIFDSKEEALFTLGELLPDSPENRDVTDYISQAKDLTVKLVNAIKKMNSKLKAEESFVIDLDMRSLLTQLDILTTSSAPNKWLACYLNDHPSSEIQRLLSVLKNVNVKPEYSYKFMTEVEQEMAVRGLHAAKQRIMQHLIYPSRYKQGQIKHNHEILKQTEERLKKAKDKAEVNMALDYLIDAYKFRYNAKLRTMQNKQAETVKIAKSFKFDLELRSN